MLEIHITTTAEHIDNLSDQLLLLEAKAITWKDAENHPIYEPLPGEIIPWQTVIIVALFELSAISNETCAYLNKLQKNNLIQRYQIIEVPNNDWITLSQKDFKANLFGNRLWIIPDWLAPTNVEAVNVYIAPGLAFGTGIHPTTALCLKWLDQNIQGNEMIIDYGCGSGILTIAAIMLGAAKAIAIDHDPQALEACLHNAELNQCTNQITTLPALNAALASKADIILANIVAKTLIQLKQQFLTHIHPHGRLVLSGIMTSEYEMVLNTFKPDFKLIGLSEQNEWVQLTLQAV